MSMLFDAGIVCERKRAKQHHHEQSAEGEAEAVVGRMFDINTKILYTI